MNALSQNKIKQIRCLQQKKCRDEHDLFVVEGEKMVAEVLMTASEHVEFCVSTADFYSEYAKGVEWYQCDEETLKRCSSLKTPNKVIAVVRKMAFPDTRTSFLLALDEVQDPGNMGTIMRLADWFGVKKIICSRTTVDVYNPKVIQASMGAFLRVQVEYTDLKPYFQKTQLPVFGALLEGENIYKTTVQPEGILLMGNEGNGISEELRSFISHPVSIPKRGGAESLNVSIATGILLSEFFRNA
ncbi:RNA methyltransferase [Crocinitomicaceae bacterium CZZ-1]|uniref:RNA methyltransferase n=1 Tax=Taishania pollutisoli TaxID=2766479 RepID=A0A8J6P494_9FLAO|nr:RNA methyltransferase [Taishania pollutisoli]